jgi:hypothetical protein
MRDMKKNMCVKCEGVLISKGFHANNKNIQRDLCEMHHASWVSTETKFDKQSLC